MKKLCRGQPNHRHHHPSLSRNNPNITLSSTFKSPATSLTVSRIPPLK
ncbi:hypothetical protein [Granulicella sibirica]|uniref:Uncharacterized protein n=1 Tax=Granulicella sibirica TaxID=2479048 RepID=A0A4Q0SXC3_9BACT|nr:hypothetical protein [Granulicella sibirica]RXH55773.1 hypothetical protein GRAN_2630 [Granulicella sibirica]